MKCDVVVDLAYGDCGKGKISHSLLSKQQYSHVLRYNGANNCGHTIFHKGEKFVTHAVPAGVFYGVRSVIGPGCVVHPASFLKEVEELNNRGIDCSNLKIAHNTNIITNQHIEEDSTDSKIGTTKKGVGPAYRDKYARVGIQAHQVPELKEFLIDIYQEFFKSPGEPVILAEGAQGFYLDPHWGEIPYVTSSHCTVGGVMLNGVPHSAIRDVYGVCKAYDTYVGNKQFQPEGEIYNQLREAGGEYGSTTGRSRQCNFLDIRRLIKAIEVNAVTDIVINKMDILQQLDCWKMIIDDQVCDLKNEGLFKGTIQAYVPGDARIHYSYSPDKF